MFGKYPLAAIFISLFFGGAKYEILSRNMTENSKIILPNFLRIANKNTIHQHAFMTFLPSTPILCCGGKPYGSHVVLHLCLIYVLYHKYGSKDFSLRHTCIYCVALESKNNFRKLPFVYFFDHKKYRQKRLQNE